MSSQELILYEVKNRVAILTLDRPPVHVFNLDLMKIFYEKLVQADNDEEVKCILLKSSGDRVFSAGIDVKGVTPDDVEYLAELRSYGRKITESMLLIKKPIIAQVQGSAIGFGMELIMACDMRIFANRPKEEMFFRMPEIAISIYPQTGATILPLLNFGLINAKKMLFTADEYSLEDLNTMNPGFCTRIVDLKELDVETRKFIRTFSKRDHAFTFLIKSTLTIMNNKLISRWYDLEDNCGEAAYKKMSMKDLDSYIKELYKKYP